ncbi:hypothetical protein PPERSA_02807 [Pseudocohnilembus persalinus]|uniref:Galactose-binding domain protein n=1 Tax=Pseudocohnilembus persalinus TaxID=266149 RepID=A0A0V0QMI0_PSEPJ|nr:hypothetical protein PPERSA_02807 [Pseudocohnilembus persalinus]|eukprot:KRX03428.1 hypothetical protein PPERSA_02807 [Pseudocohnilembus persalinus]
MSEQGLPQHFIIDISELKNRPKFLKCVGFDAWHDYNTNPKVIELSLSVDNENFITWTTIYTELRAGLQMFEIDPLGRRYNYMKFTIKETFGGSKTYLNQVYLLEENPISKLNKQSFLSNTTEDSRNIYMQQQQYQAQQQLQNNSKFQQQKFGTGRYNRFSNNNTPNMNKSANEPIKFKQLQFNQQLEQLNSQSQLYNKLNSTSDRDIFDHQALTQNKQKSKDSSLNPRQQIESPQNYLNQNQNQILDQQNSQFNSGRNLVSFNNVGNNQNINNYLSAQSDTATFNNNNQISNQQQIKQNNRKHLYLQELEENEEQEILQQKNFNQQYYDRQNINMQANQQQYDNYNFRNQDNTPQHQYKQSQDSSITNLYAQQQEMEKNQQMYENPMSGQHKNNMQRQIYIMGDNDDEQNQNLDRKKVYYMSHLENNYSSSQNNQNMQNYQDLVHPQSLEFSVDQQGNSLQSSQRPQEKIQNSKQSDNHSINQNQIQQNINRISQQFEQNYQKQDNNEYNEKPQQINNQNQQLVVQKQQYEEDMKLLKKQIELHRELIQKEVSLEIEKLKVNMETNEQEQQVTNQTIKDLEEVVDKLQQNIAFIADKMVDIQQGFNTVREDLQKSLSASQQNFFQKFLGQTQPQTQNQSQNQQINEEINDDNQEQDQEYLQQHDIQQGQNNLNQGGNQEDQQLYETSKFNNEQNQDQNFVNEQQNQEQLLYEKNDDNYQEQDISIEQIIQSKVEQLEEILKLTMNSCMENISQKLENQIVNGQQFSTIYGQKIEIIE